MDHRTTPGIEPLAATPHEVQAGAIAQALQLPWPDSWNIYRLSLGAMLALAGLDFVGSIFAKEWTERQQPWLFLAGLASFAILFIVFANSLKVAELSIMTFGWVIFLQVGLLLVDRFRYGVEFPTGKWAAIVVILALQAYLILAPNGKPEAGV
jgi:hypothetical protein